MLITPSLVIDPALPPASLEIEYGNDHYDVESRVFTLTYSAPGVAVYDFDSGVDSGVTITIRSSADSISISYIAGCDHSDSYGSTETLHQAALAGLDFDLHP